METWTKACVTPLFNFERLFCRDEYHQSAGASRIWTPGNCELSKPITLICRETAWQGPPQPKGFPPQKKRHCLPGNIGSLFSVISLARGTKMRAPGSHQAEHTTQQQGNIARNSCLVVFQTQDFLFESSSKGPGLIKSSWAFQFV